MLRYAVLRVLSALSVVVVAVVASFLLFFVAPTDPAGAMCGPRCPPARYAEIRRSLDLDRPLPEQVGGYLTGLVVGRTVVAGGVAVRCPAPCLGYSYVLGQPVTGLLAQAVPVTASIVAGGAAVYLSLGVLTGIVAARRRGTVADRMTVATALAVGSLPYFVVALLVALYATFLPRYLAAWLTVGVANAAAYTRYARASMIESLGEEFVRTARAKGVRERRAVYHHGLRAALTPVATVFGLDLAFQLTGALFTEKVFGLPRLGVLTLRAFAQDDLPVLMGGVLVGAVLLVALNLAVDLLYPVLDPRVRLTG